MNDPELALHHLRLDQRTGSLRAQVARLQAELTGDPEAERLERERATAEAARRDLDLGVRDREREANARRGRLRARERDLMSGRIRNATELLKLNQEVEHLKVAVADAEEAQLALMERQEVVEGELARLTREVAAARERTAAQTPALRARLERLEDEAAQVEAERDASWEQLSDEWRRAYQRVRASDPVAEVVGGQCQACRVAVTSNGMQVLRRRGLLHCDNCGRLLVVT
jgi:predicted  nucleic acid-binding Zn-ribbon protein